MSSTTTLRLDAAEAPGCEECLVELQPAGRGDHRYWTCHYCGTTIPRWSQPSRAAHPAARIAT